MSDPGLEISKIYQAGFGCVHKQSKYAPVGAGIFIAAANDEFAPVQKGVALRHDGPCAIRHEEYINNPTESAISEQNEERPLLENSQNGRHKKEGWKNSA